jgi:hypothetical protein
MTNIGKRRLAKAPQRFPYYSAACISGNNINLLAPELFFLILAHPVYKM